MKWWGGENPLSHLRAHQRCGRSSACCLFQSVKAADGEVICSSTMSPCSDTLAEVIAGLKRLAAHFSHITVELMQFVPAFVLVTENVTHRSFVSPSFETFFNSSFFAVFLSRQGQAWLVMLHKPHPLAQVFLALLVNNLLPCCRLSHRPRIRN